MIFLGHSRVFPATRLDAFRVIGVLREDLDDPFGKTDCYFLPDIRADMRHSLNSSARSSASC